MLRSLTTRILQARFLGGSIVNRLLSTEQNMRRENIKHSEARTKTVSLNEECTIIDISELALLETIEPYSKALHHM